MSHCEYYVAVLQQLFDVCMREVVFDSIFILKPGERLCLLPN